MATKRILPQSVLFWWAFCSVGLSAQVVDLPSFEACSAAVFICGEWDYIPYTDPLCLATDSNKAVGKVFTPNTIANVVEAYEGDNFVYCVAGRANTVGPYGFIHDGLQQTISGFTIGESYVLDFHQTVYLRFGALDTIGNWTVYMDDQLLLESTPSISHLTDQGLDYSWDQRKVEFVASATTHNFKFLPNDLDTTNMREDLLPFFEVFQYTGMAIDDIRIYSCQGTFETLTAQDVTISPDIACRDEEVRLLVETGSQDSDCVWTLSDGRQYFGCDRTIMLSESGVYGVELEVTTAFGCSVTIEELDLSLTISQGPSAAFVVEASPSTIIDPTVSFIDFSTDATAYLWDFGEGTFSDRPSPTHIYDAAMGVEYLACLEVMDEAGCADDLCQIVRLTDELLISIPNAFSPDGDGLNDQWGVMLSSDNVADFSISIYDRHGREIWQSVDPGQPWTGQGAPSSDYFAPNGVYVFDLRLRSVGETEVIRHTGCITLIR